MSLCRDMMPAWELRAALDASEAECTALRAEIERLRAALRGAETWLQNWAVHAGRCDVGNVCTCGLTAIRYDVSAALEEEGE